jgi:hypothetical protein
VKSFFVLSSLIVAFSMFGTGSASAQTPAPAKSSAFEVFGKVDKSFAFYRTETNVTTHFRFSPTPTGFDLKIDSDIFPNADNHFMPSKLYNFNVATSTKTLQWTSTLCWPRKVYQASNPYIKSLACNSTTGGCEIEFAENFGSVKQKDVPYSTDQTGAVQIASKDVALALNGKVPNTTAEFKALTSKTIRYGRIAFSDMTCTPSAGNVMTCVWSMEKDQNPFPTDRPWDDCTPN